MEQILFVQALVNLVFIVMESFQNRVHCSCIPGYYCLLSRQSGAHFLSRISTIIYLKSLIAELSRKHYHYKLILVILLIAVVPYSHSWYLEMVFTVIYNMEVLH